MVINLMGLAFFFYLPHKEARENTLQNEKMMPDIDVIGDFMLNKFVQGGW